MAEPLSRAVASQAVFHAVMMALARPGSVQPLSPQPDVPSPLSTGLAAVALALADHETTVWLDGALAADPAVRDYLRFETGARLIGDPASATFALLSDATRLPPLAAFAQGTDDDPDRSTTVLIAVDRLDQGPALRLSGPGIEGETVLRVESLPQDFGAALAGNRAAFPRGVDCLLVAPAAVAGLPRSTRVQSVLAMEA